jgi:hypothetical protein
VFNFGEQSYKKGGNSPNFFWGFCGAFFKGLKHKKLNIDDNTDMVFALIFCELALRRWWVGDSWVFHEGFLA